MADLGGALLAQILFVLVFSVLSIGFTPADMLTFYVAWLPIPIVTAVAALLFERRRVPLSSPWRFSIAATATMSGMILGLIAGPLISSPDELTLFRIAVIGSSVVAAVLLSILMHIIVRAATRH